jgi:uncharacterized protein (TIGR02246 family)
VRALILVGSFASALLSGSTQTPAQDADRAQIGVILDNFDAAYRKRDGALWARYFAEDADFMQAFGRYAQGRATIERIMTRFIASQTDAMQGKEISRRIAFPAPNVAVAELTEEISGIREADGTEQPPRRGHLMLMTPCISASIPISNWSL